jgi:glyoxylase-like metal-dependent hydrolase (beta-lactamase superfamily II)
VELVFNPGRPETGVVEDIAAGIRRLVAPNPGPFTFTGTCSYLVGADEVIVIDPGPEDDAHLVRLLSAIGGAAVLAILVTHTHRDHSPLSRRLQAETGAPILGCAPHFAARALRLGEINPLDASSDALYQPDAVLLDGASVTLGASTFEVIATPGHTANHLAFALPAQGIVFTGDHIMGWSTSIVAPPDGAMGAYMASLEAMIAREADQLYLPGHGAPVADPRRFARGLLQHRRHRENQIMDRLLRQPMRIPELVAANYPGLNPALTGAAGLSVFAHLEDLHDRGLVNALPNIGFDAVFGRR